MKYDANNVKLMVGGVGVVGGYDCGRVPTKKQWYKILEQNNETFKAEWELTNGLIATATVAITELDKFLELEDSVESPFYCNVDTNNIDFKQVEKEAKDLTDFFSKFK